MYEPKLEFPEGWEVQTKRTLCGGEYGYFLEQHIVRETFSCNSDGSSLQCEYRRLHIEEYSLLLPAIETEKTLTV